MKDQEVGKLASRMLAEDKSCIAYRPQLVGTIGSVMATILLQQINYRFINNGMEPFYKFKEPCQHSAYRKGDSWVEETAFTKYEFNAALALIGTKITKGVSKSDALKIPDTTGLVLYWIDANRMTWYMVNVNLLGKLIAPTYVDRYNQHSFITKNTTDHKRTKKRRPSAYATEAALEEAGIPAVIGPVPDEWFVDTTDASRFPARPPVQYIDSTDPSRLARRSSR